jgi:predicted nuclease with TOPRIM domain
MADEHDSSEFIDTDFTARKSPFAAPSRDDVDRKVVEAQQKLVELKRAQEELERERAGLEELRRRQTEFQTGRDEVIQNLTRGLGLLEEAEFTARRDAEQMAKTLADFRDALSKVEAVHEETWTVDNFNVELTRALTAIENARMEWNAARLKFPILSGQTSDGSEEAASVARAPEQSLFASGSFASLCKVGLALTLPLVLLALGILLVLLLRR